MNPERIYRQEELDWLKSLLGDLAPSDSQFWYVIEIMEL